MDNDDFMASIVSSMTDEELEAFCDAIVQEIVSEPDHEEKLEEKN